MTPQDVAYWLRAQRRVAGMTPEIRDAVLRAFEIIRDSLTDAQLARLIASGNVERLVAELLTQSVLDRAFIPLRTRLRQGIERQVKYFAVDLPKAGRVNGVLAIAFDYLNPATITAIRALESKVMQTLSDDVRDTVRAYIEQGLRTGVGPRTIAIDLRSVIGLAPNQLTAVQNFEKALRGDGRNPLDYALRDKRFDRALAKGPLSEAQIESMTAAYRRKMIAFNAETNSRTATLDAMKLGQRLAWQEAIDAGIVDGSRLGKTWIGVMDERERPEHVAMEHETVPFNDPFSNGEMIPGDSTFNCRCVARYGLTGQ